MQHRYWELLDRFSVYLMGMIYLERRRKKAQEAGEGYFGFNGDGGETAVAAETVNPLTVPLAVNTSPGRQIFAFIPLVLVGVANKFFTISIPKWYPEGFDFSKIGLDMFGKVDLATVTGIWSVELA